MLVVIKSDQTVVQNTISVINNICILKANGALNNGSVSNSPNNLSHRTVSLRLAFLFCSYVMYSKPRVKALLELIYVCWLNSLFVNTMLPQIFPRFLNEVNKTAPAHTLQA